MGDEELMEEAFRIKKQLEFIHLTKKQSLNVFCLIGTLWSRDGKWDLGSGKMFQNRSNY